MTKTRASNEVARLSAMREGYPLDAAYAKEMTRTLMATFAAADQVARCIDDMIDGGVMPAPTAIRAWARMHGSQKPQQQGNGAADGAGLRRAATECPDCSGTGIRPHGEPEFDKYGLAHYKSSCVCECRSVGVA